MTVRNAVWAKCRECGEVWPAAHLPMEVEAAARQMMAAICPKCGNDSPVLAGKADIPATHETASGIPIVRRKT